MIERSPDLTFVWGFVRSLRSGLKDLILISLHSHQTQTFLTRMVRPWYLNGLEKSMCPALSGFMVSGATIMSASLLISSAMTPFHFFSPVLLTFIAKKFTIAVYILLIYGYMYAGEMQIKIQIHKYNYSS